MADSLPSSKRRSACDRCHSQKLRCTKSPEKSACDRCLRLGGQCIFSPSMRGLVRPSQVLGRRGYEEMASSNAVSENGVYHPHQEVHDTFDPMLIDWDSASNQPGLPDSTIGLDGFFLGDTELDLPPGLTKSTTITNGQSGSVAPHRPLSPSQDVQGDYSGQVRPDENPSGFDHPDLEYRTFQPADWEQTGMSNCAFISARSNSVLMVQELSALSSQLAEHAATVPPHSIHTDFHLCLPSHFGTQPDSAASKSLPGVANTVTGKCIRCYGDGVFSIDQTFHLTEKLVDLYPRFNETIVQSSHVKLPQDTQPRSRSPSSQDLTPSNSPFQENGRQPISKTDTGATDSSSYRHPTFFPSSLSDKNLSGSAPLLDQGSILLLMSCHNRLVDIWDTALGHIEIKRREYPKYNHTNLDSRCAKIKIGSHVLSSQSTTIMYITLIIELAEKLLEQVRKLMELIAKVSSPKSTNCFTLKENPSEYTQEMPYDNQKTGSGALKLVDECADATTMVVEATIKRASQMVTQIRQIQQQLALQTQ